MPRKVGLVPSRWRGRVRYIDAAEELDSYGMPLLPFAWMLEPVRLGVALHAYVVLGRRADERATRWHHFELPESWAWDKHGRLPVRWEEQVLGKFPDDLRSMNRDRLLPRWSCGLQTSRRRARGPRHGPCAWQPSLRHDPSGTSIEPFVAEWLYRRREPFERNGVLTVFAWCAHCGQLFTDRRTEYGHVARIARWCQRCRRTRRRHVPHQRVCAAADCRITFNPRRANQIYCSRDRGERSIAGRLAVGHKCGSCAQWALIVPKSALSDWVAE